MNPPTAEIRQDDTHREERAVGFLALHDAWLDAPLRGRRRPLSAASIATTATRSCSFIRRTRLLSVSRIPGSSRGLVLIEFPLSNTAERLSPIDAKDLSCNLLRPESAKKRNRGSHVRRLDVSSHQTFR